MIALQSQSALVIKWVVINDLHAGDDDAKNPYAKLGQAMHMAKDSACNFVVLNGDLHSKYLGGSTDSLQDSATLKRLRDSCAITDSPKIYVAGNHDVEKYGLAWFTRMMGQNSNQTWTRGNINFISFWTGTQYADGLSPNIKDTVTGKWVDSVLNANKTKPWIGFSHWMLYDSAGGYFSDYPGGRDSSAYWRNKFTVSAYTLRYLQNGHGSGANPKQGKLQYHTVQPCNYATWPNNSYEYCTYDTTAKTVTATLYSNNTTYRYAPIGVSAYLDSVYFACLPTATTADSIKARLNNGGMTDTVAQKFFLGTSDSCIVNGVTIKSTRRGFKVSGGLTYYECDYKLLATYGDAVDFLIAKTASSSFKTHVQSE